MHRRASRSHLLAPFAALVAATLVGCGPTPATPVTPAATQQPPSGSPIAVATALPTVAPSSTPFDPVQVYGTIAGQVEQIRGLEPKADVKPVLIDQATLTANLTADFDKSNPASAVTNGSRELIALGLLPAGSNLRTLILALQSGQVAGYYSPPDHQLFVVSKAGGIGPTQRVTYAHEFTHELQDQNFKLADLHLQTPDEGDRNLARLSLVEGDAVVTQVAWMQGNLSAADLQQVVQDALDPAAAAALQNAPYVLQQTSLFPYTSGLQFVQTIMANGGYNAVNAAFASPPDSTEQILHPDKYTAHEAPIEVKPATGMAQGLGSGWSEVARDTLGELMLQVWLHQGGLSTVEADSAAAGWGGDRLVQFAGPNDATALAIETAWDTSLDADEFASALNVAIAGLHLHGAILHAAGSTTVSIALGPDDTTAKALASELPG